MVATQYHIILFLTVPIYTDATKLTCADTTIYTDATKLANTDTTIYTMQQS